jgi:hypothetical protein
VKRLGVVRGVFVWAWGRLTPRVRAFVRRGLEAGLEAAGDPLPDLLAVGVLPGPTLADLGIDVVGCSACRVTPCDRVCVGCGNMGAAPARRRRARVRVKGKKGGK